MKNFELDTSLPEAPFPTQLSKNGNISPPTSKSLVEFLSQSCNALLSDPYFSSSSLTIRLVSVLVSLVVILKLFQYLQGDSSYKKFHAALSNIPGPKSSWIIGNAHQLWSSTERFNTLKSWSLQYGSCFRFKLGIRNIVVLNSPSAIQKLLSSTEHGHFNKGLGYEIFRPFWKDGLVLSETDKWKERRRFISRAFTVRAFLGYMHVYNKESKALVSNLETLFQESSESIKLNGRKTGVAIDKILWQSTLRVICETVMGTDIWGFQGHQQLTTTLNTCKMLCMMRALRPWLMNNWIWRWHPKSSELAKGAAELSAFTHKVIELRRSKIKADETAADDNDQFDEDKYVPGMKRDFKSMLEEMIKAGFDMEALTEEVQTLITTGYETSATTLQFVLFLLALHPKYQKICQEEIDQVFEDVTLCPNGDLTYDSLNKLKFLERCIFETLRVFPVAFMFIRRLDSPLKIDDTLELPPGLDVGIFTPGIHHNPEYYPDPHIFNPDRFNAAESKDRGQFAFIPFSAGQRNCIGYKFGLLEIKVLAARILRQFWVDTTDKFDDVAVLPETVLTPERGYNFILTKRK